MLSANVSRPRLGAEKFASPRPRLQFEGTLEIQKHARVCALFAHGIGGNRMKIKCSEFENGAVIPERFSQYDVNRSPPLDFVDVPPKAQSLALIMDDPDGPRGTF